MPKHIRYANPPAREAVCEIRFTHTQWDAAIPGLVYVRLKDQFPERKMSTNVTLAAQRDAVPAQLGVAQVSRFLQPDGRSFVQLAPHAISVHRLSPYEGWNQFRPVIARVFEVYTAEAKPDKVERIGLRFVNDFRDAIQDAEVEPHEYLNFYPHVGPALPQMYADAHARVVFMFDQERTGLRLQLYSESRPPDDIPSLVLDLDYFTNEPGVEIDDVIPWLEMAHERVRTVFEACLTSKLRALLGPSEPVEEGSVSA
jgi:uncharacterized protein (TIGR04255 family)